MNLTQEYRDHVGYAYHALALLVYHLGQLQDLATHPADRDAIGTLVAPLGRLHSVVSDLHYKHHED